MGDMLIYSPLGGRGRSDLVNGEVDTKCYIARCKEIVNDKEYFYSNCLLEALKAWVKSPRKIIIKKRGSYKMIYKKRMFPHFYWIDKRNGLWFDFARDDKVEGLCDQIYFRGHKRQIRCALLFNH